MMTHEEPNNLEVLITRLVLGTVGRPFYRAYVDSLPLQGHERVLDYGSGSGAEARYLARRLLTGGGRLTCVDISRVWTQVARRTLRRFPNVEFKQGSIADLDIAEGAYDAVVIHFVLHDIAPGDRPDIVAHLARKLRPGGQLFIREPLQQGKGIPTAEIRHLMQQAGLRETSAAITHARFTGVMFAGAFRK